MNRRKFLKNTAGLFVPAAFGIGRAKADVLFAPWNMNAAVSSGGGGACTTQGNQQAGTTTGNVSIDDNPDGSESYQSTTFTASGSYTVCSVTMRLGKAGSPTFHMKAAIYTDNGSGVPNALVGTASSAVAVSGFSTTEADVQFTGMSAAITSGTVYHIVIWDSDLSGYGGGVNFVRCYYANNSATHIYRSTNGTTWVLDTTNVELKFTIFH